MLKLVAAQAEDKLVAELFDSTKYVNWADIVRLSLVHLKFLGHSTEHLDVIGVIQRTTHVFYGVDVPFLDSFDQYVGVTQILDVRIHFIERYTNMR